MQNYGYSPSYNISSSPNYSLSPTQPQNPPPKKHHYFLLHIIILIAIISTIIAFNSLNENFSPKIGNKVSSEEMPPALPSDDANMITSTPVKAYGTGEAPPALPP